MVNWGDRGVAVDKIDGETKQVSRSLPGLRKEDLKQSGGIYHVFEGRSGLVWLAMNNGLGCYDPQRGRFTRYVHDSNDPRSLITNDLECTYEDRTGTLWIANYHYGPTGVGKLEREKERFTHINLVP